MTAPAKAGRTPDPEAYDKAAKCPDCGRVMFTSIIEPFETRCLYVNCRPREDPDAVVRNPVAE